MINNARTQARQCGTQSFAATTPLARNWFWAPLRNVIQAMANQNF